MSSSICIDPPPFLERECFQGRIIDGLSYEQLFLTLEWLSKTTASEGSGGLSVFMGFVKGVIENSKVLKLIYTSYEPYASIMLDKIAKSYSLNPNLYGVIILHTNGVALPGSPTLFVAVSGKTRKDSLDVVKEVVERVKKEPPIFKLEVREDGEYWILGDGKRVARPK